MQEVSYPVYKYLLTNSSINLAFIQSTFHLFPRDITRDDIHHIGHGSMDVLNQRRGIWM